MEKGNTKLNPEIFIQVAVEKGFMNKGNGRMTEVDCPLLPTKFDSYFGEDVAESIPLASVDECG